MRSTLVDPGDGNIHRASFGHVHVLLPVDPRTDRGLLPLESIPYLRVLLTVEGMSSTTSICSAVNSEVNQSEIDLLSFL